MTFSLSPTANDRDQAAILAELLTRLPGYTPEWSYPEGSSSAALLRIFARYMEILHNGLNRVPERSLMSFLDMVGIQLLPAQAARAPLVFKLMDKTPVDVTLPANSQVAAPAKPALPLASSGGKQDVTPPQPTLFATTQTILLTRAKLAAVYSVQPATDEYADHTTQLTDGLTLFGDLQPMEHAIYLGHDPLFALANDADVTLSFGLQGADPFHRVAAPDGQLAIKWEYFSVDGWLPLQVKDDSGGDFTKTGQVVLHKSCGPDSKKDKVSVYTSYWIRGTLSQPLPPQGKGGKGPLPIVDTLKFHVGYTKGGLAPEKAFVNAIPLDTTKSFFPFGAQPAPYATFYLASKEVFQRKNARVHINIKLSTAGPKDSHQIPLATLAWDYFDGASWQPLEGNYEFSDTTHAFTATAGQISFICPPDWSETKVNGQSNYWLRGRVVAGDFGTPLQLEVSGNSIIAKAGTGTQSAPVVSEIKLRYIYQTEQTLFDQCLAKNNFVFEDDTEAARWQRQTFQPFQRVADAQPAVYFAFDRALPAGLISFFISVPPQAGAERQGQANAFIWEYCSPRGWDELGVLDRTIGFQRSEMVQFVGPADAVATPGVGTDDLHDKLFRIRAKLKQGGSVQPLPLGGVWLNAVWANHQQSYDGEMLGISDANPGQAFRFRNAPVLEGESVEVQEWSGRGMGWELAVQDIRTPSDIRYERDAVTGQISAVWVRWYPQPQLYDSTASDRHYTLERANGLLRFGDGQNGRIPPPGSQLLARYTSGGGVQGNVPAGSIAELHAAVPFVMQVSNPVAAEGGSQIETVRAVQRRGPQQLRHHNRGLSDSDLEWLAREASPAVARARCLPTTGPVGRVQRGWITLLIVPNSQEPQPQPTPELQREVREYLAARVPATVAPQIRVSGPAYMPISIVAEIVPLQAEDAGYVEGRVRDALNHFLHPLTGGLEEMGWTFGQPVYLSQIAAVIENTRGVDYASSVSLRADGQVFDEVVVVESNSLVAAGIHELKLTLGKD